VLLLLQYRWQDNTNFGDFLGGAVSHLLFIIAVACH